MFVDGGVAPRYGSWMDELQAFVATLPGQAVLVLCFGAATALIAHRKGYRTLPWFLSGCALFIIAFPVILLKKPDRAALDRRALATGEAKRCPHCAELIRPEAKVCRFCGQPLGVES